MLKTAHLNKPRVDAALSNYALRRAAGEKEKQGDLPAAISLYQQCVKRMPKNEFAYSRLMILYRRQKAYKKEMTILKTAIRVFEKLYKPKRMVSRMISTLSKQISKATGLADAKGNQTFHLGPVEKWKKRLVFLEKRLHQ